MTETNIMHKIQIALSKAGARVLRNHVGMGWIGEVEKYPKPTRVMVYPTDVVIRNARPFTSGLGTNSADLIGWDSETGHFVACEVKSPGKKPTNAQLAFLYAVKQSGGIAIWADSVDTAVKKYGDAKHGKQI